MSRRLLFFACMIAANAFAVSRPAIAADLVVEWLEFDTSDMDRWNDAYRAARVSQQLHLQAKWLADLSRQKHASTALRFQFQADGKQPVPLEAAIGDRKFSASVTATPKAPDRYQINMDSSIRDKKGSFRSVPIGVELSESQEFVLSAGPETRSFTPANGPAQRTTTIQFFVIRLLAKPNSQNPPPSPINQ
jgi:hypothetical protein